MFRSSTVNPASSDRRMPVSRNTMMMALSRRSTKLVPLQTLSRSRASAVGNTSTAARARRVLAWRPGRAVQLLVGDGPLDELLQRPVAHRHGRRRVPIGQVGEERADGVAVEIAELRGSGVVDERGQAVAVGPQRLVSEVRALSARIHDLCSRFQFAVDHRVPRSSRSHRAVERHANTT